MTALLRLAAVAVVVPIAACHDSDRVTRGQQLVTMGGCGECHTPRKLDLARHMPVPDLSRLFAGHPEGAPDPAAVPGATDQAVVGATFTSFTTGFGIVYSRNLTPDDATGLGIVNTARSPAAQLLASPRGTGLES